MLLREAHDLAGLPVSVFRCDMIMADTTYAGQLNVPDMFTRMMLSLVATGIAPNSFYELDAGGSRQRAHFDGLPVEFIADAISTLGAHVIEGFETYHVMNPYDDGISMDTFVDWLVEAGYPIVRVPGYAAWLAAVRDHAAGTAGEATRRRRCCRCCTTTRSPNTRSTGHSRRRITSGPPCRRPRSGRTRTSRTSSAPVIVKYVTDLELLGLL